jgi:hypothetical protein
LKDEKETSENLKKEIKSMTQFNTEKYFIENAILFNPIKFENEIPANLKVLYLTFNEWDIFNKNPVFCENIAKSLDFVTETSKVDKTIYWMVTLYRLLNLLKNESSDKFKSVFKELSKKDGFKIQSFNHEKIREELIVSKQKCSFNEKTFEKFLTKTHEILTRTLLQLVDFVVAPLTESIDDILSELKKGHNHLGLSNYNEAQVNGILNKLYEIYSQFQQQFIHPQILNFYFECVLVRLDEFIFNTLITQPIFTTKGIQIKMLLSSIEQWFEEKEIKTSK